MGAKAALACAFRPWDLAHLCVRSWSLGIEGKEQMKNIKLMLALAAGLLGISGQAMADPRDDVLAGATRCNAIVEYRSWLECYYGAAQPMRTVLGLSPAPASQTRLVPGAGAGPAYTPPAYTPPAQGQPLFGNPRVATAAPARPAGPPPMPVKRVSSGIWGTLMGGAVLVNKMPMSNYSFNGSGAFSVTLADGQVWEQLPNDVGTTRAQWSDPASKYRVTVKEGSVNTYNLSVGVDGKLYKVRRVR